MSGESIEKISVKYRLPIKHEAKLKRTGKYFDLSRSMSEEEYKEMMVKIAKEESCQSQSEK